MRLATESVVCVPNMLEEGFGNLSSEFLLPATCSVSFVCCLQGMRQSAHTWRYACGQCPLGEGTLYGGYDWDGERMSSGCVVRWGHAVWHDVHTSRKPVVRGVNSTPDAHTFFLMHSCCTVILSLTPRTDLTHRSRTTEYIVSVLLQNIHTSSRNVTPHLMTPRALPPHMSHIHLSASTNPAEIYGHI